MAKWDVALSSEKLLKKFSLHQMWTSPMTDDGAYAPFNYGLGWFIDSYHGHRLVQHSGGTPGFSSVIYRFLDDKLTIIILTNHADRIVDQLAIDLAGTCLPALKRPAPNDDPNPTTTATFKTTRVRFIERGIRTGIIYSSHGDLPEHSNRQSILEMVRRSRRAGQLGFL